MKSANRYDGVPLRVIVGEMLRFEDRTSSLLYARRGHVRTNCRSVQTRSTHRLFPSNDARRILSLFGRCMGFNCPIERPTNRQMERQVQVIYICEWHVSSVMTVFLDNNIVKRIVPDHGEESQKQPIRYEFPLSDCKKLARVKPN